MWEINGGYVYVGRDYSNLSNPLEYSPFVGIIVYDHSNTYSYSTRYTNGVYYRRHLFERENIDIASSSFSYAQYDKQMVQHVPNFKYSILAGGSAQGGETYSIMPVIGVADGNSSGTIRGYWRITSADPLQITAYHWQYVQ